MESLDNVTAARKLLERHGEVSHAYISAEISASWSRCLEMGLDPMRPPKLRRMESTTWRETKEQHEKVSRIARREIETLHGQIAGSNFLIAFAGPDGTVLDALVDGSFRRPAQDRALGPGTCWSEMMRGTNALGLTAALRRPAVVHGWEHFFHGDGDLTCVAAPVWGPDGALAGVMDASSSCSTRQMHTRALLSMAATQVENALFRDAHHNRLLLAFHGREEFLYTSGAGLLSLGADGQLLGASPQAQLMLHDLPLSPGATFASIFEGRFGEIVAGRASGETFRLCDRSHSGFFAAIVARPAASPPRTPSARLAAPPPPAYVAEDPAVARALSLAAAAARRHLPILIGGETGTGKEDLARSAHRASQRAGRFVPVNCAALPGELVEAELFGYAEGAFTGARRGGAAGLAVEADGGTLFLDEIGDMDQRAQAALLRLLDDWVVRPVGGGAGRQVNVLLIAATNVDLEAAVAAGRFRADLLHRLAVVPVRLPRLAERRDFEAVAIAVAAKIDPQLRLTAPALALLAQQGWGGNIRELRNVLTRASLEGPKLLEPAQLRPFLPGRPASQALGQAACRLDEQMAHAINVTRGQCNGSISETARRLGISRNRVYRALRNSNQGTLHG